MNTWDCCRACLDITTLTPIFSAPEHSEKYSEVILATTSIKVELNDTLPQEMCQSCINFINCSYKFRKKCKESEKTLLSRIYEKQIYKIKLESNILKSENNIAVIDISDLLNDHKSFNDNENNINDFIDSVENDNQNLDFECGLPEIIEKPVENVLKIKKRKNVEKQPRRSMRSKKESEVKKPRVKEKIECEYCHKILTSKLSLRNHYKIHTGFDVQCEHCGKKFITRRLLLMHCRAKHGYEKTDKCSYCDYRASNAEQVKIHERLHTGEKPYVCDSCGAGFHRKSSYLQHVAIHLPDKTVQCDQCPARFKSVTLMRIHKNRHRAPQYSFKCRVCENNFARRRNVARHLQRIHGLQPTQEHIDRLKIA